jgi:hypothetical protein
MKVCTYCNSFLQASSPLQQQPSKFISNPSDTQTSKQTQIPSSNAGSEDFSLRRGSLNQLLPSPIAGKKVTAAGISAAKRRHLVGRCHSDTSHLNSVQAQIARVAAATHSFHQIHPHSQDHFHQHRHS